MNQSAPAESDLIAALATGAGPAAIAVLRLSGTGAVAAARKFLVGLPLSPPPRRLTRALAVQDGAQPLDDVLVAVFPAPHSYTGENVVEVHCHGGLALAAAVQDLALKAGARLARAGEFTERAVQNGKMDLLDAEALAAVLEADGPAELEAARESRRLAPLLRSIAGRSREALAVARGTLDYPLDAGTQPLDWRAEAGAIAAEVERLIASPPLEDAFREGVVIALLGSPNAGKSSLFNALVGEHRALVDAHPGTTRDAQPCALFLGGRRLTIVDTAGIRAASGIEALAVERALEVSRTADMLLWVEDISAPVSDPPVPVELRVLAKSDLTPHASRLGRRARPSGRDGAVLRVSTRNGDGISELRRIIQARAQNGMALVSSRQKRLLEEAVAALRSMPDTTDDLATEHLSRAQQALALLAGTDGGHVNASEIYSRFCVGK